MGETQFRRISAVTALLGVAMRDVQKTTQRLCFEILGDRCFVVECGAELRGPYPLDADSGYSSVSVLFVEEGPPKNVSFLLDGTKRGRKP